MALHRWPAFKPPLQNFNPTFSSPNMANYNQLTNAIPTTGAQYQVTQLSHPNNQMRMMSAPRPVITHHVMIVSTLTHYPTQLPSPTALITQPYPATPMYTPPRTPFYHQPPKPRDNPTYQNSPQTHPLQQAQQQPSKQQQRKPQSPKSVTNIAKTPSKRALKRMRQKLKKQHQQSIMNDKIANQSLKVPIENQSQQHEIIVVNENAPKSTVIDDQTDDQSSAQM